MFSAVHFFQAKLSRYSRPFLIPPAGNCFSSRYHRILGGGRASGTRQRRVREAPATTSTTEPSLWPTRLIPLGGTGEGKSYCEMVLRCERNVKKRNVR